MKISVKRMKSLFNESLLEALRGAIDDLDSPLTAYESPFANRASRIVLVVAENIAATLNRLKATWQSIFSSSKNITLVQTERFFKAADAVWSRKLLDLKNVLENSFKSNDEQLKKNLPYIHRLKENLLILLQQLEATILQLRSLPNYLIAKDTKEAKEQQRQPLPQAQMDAWIAKNLTGVIDSIFDFIPTSLNLLKQARGLYQKVGEGDPKIGSPLPLNKKINKVIVPVEQNKILSELDDLVTKYYSSIEALFHSLLTIELDLKRHQFDIGGEILGVPEPPAEDGTFATDPSYLKRRRDQRWHHRRAMQDLFQTSKTDFSNPSQTFNKDIFLNFVSGHTPMFRSDNSNEQSYEASKYKNEATKAKIIQKLMEEINNIDKEIGILFEKPVQQLQSIPPQPGRNPSRTLQNQLKKGTNIGVGAVNKVLFNQKTGKYIFPEIEPMFRNMIRVKKIYKSKFAEIMSELEQFSYKDLKNAKVEYHREEIPKGSGNWQVVKKLIAPEVQFADLLDFFNQKRKTIQEAIKFIKFAEVQFKNLIIKMLTGQGFEKTAIRDIVNSTSEDREKKIQDRLHYYNIFQKLGWLPKGTDAPPEWLYSH